MLERDAFYQKYAVFLEDEENITFYPGDDVYIDIDSLEDLNTIRFLLGMDIILTEYSLILLDGSEVENLTR